MSDSLHGNILRTQQKNVLKKYEVLHVLGTGSMGTVSMVKIKDSKIGGANGNEEIPLRASVVCSSFCSSSIAMHCL